MFLDGNWDLSLLFAANSESRKLLELMNELPGYVDIILQTSLQPEKVSSSADLMFMFLLNRELAANTAYIQTYQNASA